MRTRVAACMPTASVFVVVVYCTTLTQRAQKPANAGFLHAPPCRMRVAAGFPCGGGSLAPRRAKEAPKTGDHGGDNTPAEEALLTSDGRRHPASARGRLSCASRTGVSINVERQLSCAGSQARQRLTTPEPRALQLPAAEAGYPGYGRRRCLGSCPHLCSPCRGARVLLWS